MKKKIENTLSKKKIYSKPILLSVGGIADNTLGNYGGTNDSGGSLNGGKK